MTAPPRRKYPFFYTPGARPRPVIRRRHGFTLVECVLAIGVVAFALVSMVGLIPMGLTAFSQALDTSTSSRIVQQIVTDLQQSATLPPQQPLRYFDDEGFQQDTSSGQSLYHVNTVVVPSTRLPGGESSNLATVLIEIAKNPKGSALSRSPATLKLIETPEVTIARYAVLIANKDLP